MVLADFIDVITGNKNIVITVKDSNEVELIKFFIGGEKVLAQDLLDRTIANLKFENATSIICELNKASSTSGTTTPTSPTKGGGGTTGESSDTGGSGEVSG